MFIETHTHASTSSVRSGMCPGYIGAHGPQPMPLLTELVLLRTILYKHGAPDGAFLRYGHGGVTTR